MTGITTADENIVRANIALFLEEKHDIDIPAGVPILIQGVTDAIVITLITNHALVLIAFVTIVLFQMFSTPLAVMSCMFLHVVLIGHSLCTSSSYGFFVIPKEINVTTTVMSPVRLLGYTMYLGALNWMVAQASEGAGTMFDLTGDAANNPLITFFILQFLSMIVLHHQQPTGLPFFIYVTSVLSITLITNQAPLILCLLGAVMVTFCYDYAMFRMRGYLRFVLPYYVMQIMFAVFSPIPNGHSSGVWFMILHVLFFPILTVINFAPSMSSEPPLYIQLFWLFLSMVSGIAHSHWTIGIVVFWLTFVLSCRNHDCFYLFMNSMGITKLKAQSVLNDLSKK